MLYHYTSIETLEKILVSKKIRFMRLDKVDDKNESELFKGINYSRVVFVSCWTVQEEYLPQWAMYGNNYLGVCISFPEKMFRYKYVKNQKYNGMDIFANAECLFTPQELMTDSYMILSTVSNWNEFCKKVKYVHNIEEIKGNIEKITRDNTSINISLSGDDLDKIAFYKSNDWAFQKEVRFSLFIFPTIGLKPEGMNQKEYQEKYVAHIANHLLSGSGNGFTFFDMEIDDSVYNSISVTLGPKCDDADYQQVKSLLTKYTNNATLSKSKFADQLREKSF